MDPLTTVNAVATISSAVLSILAIGLSVFFYTQAKNTEASVGRTLEAIRSQSDALQKLTGRWMESPYTLRYNRPRGP